MTPEGKKSPTLTLTFFTLGPVSDWLGFIFYPQVSFLELYNEEMYDLLSAAEDMNKLQLFEDPMVRGSVIINGLEDVIVTSKEQVNYTL